jgi:tetratricopeptide (TPR) repeat protein
MAAARFNYRLVVFLVASLAGLSALIWFIHNYQVRRHAAGQLALADRAEADGDTDEQIAALGRYLEFNPSDTATRARFGLALASVARTRAGRVRALRVLNQALLRDPDNHAARTRAAELSADLGETADALKYLGPVLDSRPDDADLHVLHARVLQQAGQDIQAAAALERALALEPARIPEAVQLATLLQGRIRNPRQARRVIDHMVRNNNASPASLLERAKFLVAQNLPEEAITDLQAAISRAPNAAPPRLAWAGLAAARGDLETARVQYEKAIRLAPDSAEAHLGLAWVLRELGHPAKAASALEAGLKRLKDQPGLLVALAELRAEQRKFDEAKALRRRLPSDARAAGLYIDGLVLLGGEKWTEAAEVLAEAVRTKTLPPPLASKALLALCKAFEALGAPEERLLAARHAQNLADTPAARLERARAALAVGLADEAVTQLQHLVALPRPPAGAWLLLARALIDQNLSLLPSQRHWGEADTSLDKAVVNHADAAQVAILRARILEADEKPDKAREALNAVLKRDANQAAVWLALGEMELRLGQAEQADKAFREADGRFGNSLPWLIVRAGQLSSQGTRKAIRGLQWLEQQAREIGPAALTDFQWYLIGLHAQAGRTVELARTAESLLRRFPSDPRLHLLLAEARIQDQDEEGAKERIAALKKVEGEKGAYWRVAEAQRLIARLKQGEKSAAGPARELAEQARAAQPNWSRPWLVLGRLERVLGHRAEALAAYKKALEYNDWSAEPLNQSLQLLLAAGKYPEADELIERAQRRGVVGSTMLRPAAFVAMRAGRVERARELARQAVPAGTKSYRDLVWLGRLLDGTGQHSEAEAVLRKAIALAPTTEEPWLALAQAQKRARDLDDAARTLASMRARVPVERRLMAEARGHEIMGRFREAEAALRKFLSDNPTDVEGLRRLAALLIRTNQPAAAEAVLREVLGERSHVQPEERPELRRQLALVLTAPELPRPNTEAALKLVRFNLDTEGDTEANRRTEALVRGSSALERKSALNDLAGLMSGPSVLPEELLRLATLHEQSGNWPRARELRLGLITADPDNPAYIIALIEGLIRHGRKAEALTWLVRLEKLDRDHPRLVGLRRELKEE